MRKTTLALLATVGAAGFAGAAQAENLMMMTGPQGGAWYPLGGAIQNIVQNAMPGVSIQVLPGGGVANVKGVDTGRADIAFANSVSTVDAIEGRGAFEDAATNVCNVATLYPQYFQIVALASSGIETVADLRGKSVAIQPRGNTAEEITRELLDAAGIGYEDLSQTHFVSYSDGVSLMKDNNAHAMTLGTTVPASSVMDLANSAEIRLLGLDDALMSEMQTRNPGFQRLTVPAQTYPGQGEDVSVIGYATHVVARCDLSADVVYGMLDNVMANIGDLQAIAGAMRGIEAEQMAADIGVPMHEGAARWYREQGVM